MSRVSESDGKINEIMARMKSQRRRGVALFGGNRHFCGNSGLVPWAFVRSPESEVFFRDSLARPVLILRRRFKAALIFESLSFLCERISCEVIVLDST